MEFWSRVSLESFEEWRQESSESCQRHGGETCEVKDAHCVCEFLDPRRLEGVVEAQRLEHALHTVAQVRAQQAHSDQVCSRNPPDAEPKNDIGVNVSFRILGVRGTHGQVQKVINDEGRYRRSRQIHRSGRACGDTIGLLRVGGGTSLRVDAHQLNGCQNMEANGGQQAQTGSPDDFRDALQLRRIAIDGLRTKENLEVAQKVYGYEEVECCPRSSHYGFFNDDGRKQRPC